jgi:hypothetical protein
VACMERERQELERPYGLLGGRNLRAMVCVS